MDALDNPAGNDECCVCGGGYEVIQENVPSLSPFATIKPSRPLVTNNENCADIRAWKDTFTEEGCSWYAKQLADIFPSDPTMIEATNENVTTCDLFSEKGYNKGYSATSACCICGTGPAFGFKSGGVFLDSVFIPEKYDIARRAIEPYDYCIDTPGWDFLGYGCDYVKRSTGTFSVTCERFGNVPGTNGSFTGNQACCNCGGGYSGVNIGRQFRVGFPHSRNRRNFADIPYTLFVNQSGNWDGSVVQFMTKVAAAGGFGYYEQNVTLISETNYFDDIYFACLNDVALNMIDVCIGKCFLCVTYIVFQMKIR